MNLQFEEIVNAILNAPGLSESERESLINKVREADKIQGMAQFKLDRLERDKRTLSVMLEESNEDLQKKASAIEAQNRELAIESSLERVRAQAMGMNKPEDLLLVCKMLYTELKTLGFNEIRNAIINTFDDEKAVFTDYDYSDWSEGEITYVPYDGHPMLVNYFRQIRNASDAFAEMVITAKELTGWKTFRKEFKQKDDPRLENIPALYYYFYSVGTGAIGISTFQSITEEKRVLLKRFRNVFDFAYRRFVDLEQAVEQAREAKIETALERVRSNTMAMHHSDELKEVISMTFEQIKNLNITIDSCVITLFIDGSKDLNNWVASADQKYPQQIRVPYFKHPLFDKIAEARNNPGNYFTIELSQKENQSFYKHVLENSDFGKIINADRRKLVINAESNIMSFANFKHTGLRVGNFQNHTYTQEENNTILRFANVFEQTYTRFLDLQKAEAQAREAKIEAALERVRASAMAMHKSEDLHTALAVLFEELEKLNLGLIRCGIAILDKEKPRCDVWIAIKTDKGNTIQVSGDEPLDIHPLLQGTYDAWLKQEDYYYVLEGDDLVNYYQAITRTGFQQPIAATFTPGEKEQRQYFVDTVFQDGNLFAFLNVPFTDEVKSVMKRFANVFNLTYKRFLDLQKAEAQTREAKIEASLERVRAHAMAMHNSADLSATVNIFFRELKTLGITPMRCGVGEIHEETQSSDLVFTTADKQGELYELPGKLKHEGHPVVENIYNHWKLQEEYHPVLQGTDINAYYKVIKSQMTLPDFPDYTKHYGNYFYFREGFFFAWAEKEFTEEALNIFRKFTSVLSLTYKRYKDLKKAEAQAREARIEAALEKVRSRSLAMHKAEELSEVITVVFEKLKELRFSVNDGVALITFTEGSKDLNEWMANPGFPSALKCYLPYFEHPVLINLWNAKNKGVDFIAKRYTAEENKSFLNHIFEYSDYKHTPQEIKDFCLAADAYANSIAFQKNTAIFINDYSGNPLSVQEIDILKRFSKVFEQAYIRFLDLQKAEAQAREAKIEAALERVRSKAMAMHKSEDLQPAVATVFEELEKLDLGMLRCGIGILFKDKRTGDVWTTGKSGEGTTIQVSGNESMDIHPLLQGAFDAWEKQKDFSYVLEGEDLVSYYRALQQTNFHLHESQSVLTTAGGEKQYYYVTSFQSGTIFAFRETAFPEEAKAVMKRFAGVFNLTYKRFLDIQKAEAQAREAQIEASLERVRSKTMAMHSSQDVADTVSTMFDEVVKLGMETTRCGVGIVRGSYELEVWTAIEGIDKKPELAIGRLDMRLHPLLRGAYEGWENKNTTYYYKLEGDDATAYFTAINNSPGYPVQYDLASMPATLYHGTFYFPEGVLFAFSPQQLSPEQVHLFSRFAGVFGQTYRRYLDLQKAEAQTREARIEAGLERVRSRAMAMHSSEDLAQSIGVFYRELKLLSVTPRRCGVALMDKEAKMAELTTMNTTEEGDSIEVIGKLKMSGHKVLDEVYKHWLEQKEYHVVLRGREIKEYYQVLKPQISYPDYSHDLVQYGYYFMFPEGDVTAWTDKELEEEDLKIYRRFTTVLSLTYKRYLDLKQAEDQAREATIEAALEKVRGKAMAMHNSNDLTATASLVFSELRKLDIKPMRCGVGILNKNDRKALLYSAGISDQGDSLSLIGWVMLKDQVIQTEVYDRWMRNEDYFPVLKKGMLKDYYEHLKKGLNVPGDTPTVEQYGYFIAFSEGMFYGWGEKAFTETEIKVIKRFASVIDLTFRRYMELQKSEANAKEAVKQAALDRVRAEIASMRTTSDLEKITPLIWNELTTLGIPFIRCGVFIMDNSQEVIHTFLSTPDGKAIAALHLPYSTPGNIGQIVSHWKDNKNYIDHWDKNAFTEFAHILVKQGAFDSAEQYINTLPTGGFYLHFLPFLQGMLYVGSLEQLGGEELNVLQSVADAFSTAYARYEDFNKLEAAKQQVDNTLTELKQAQQQLVQSEKMASLGELTAGIAHEIQNPLNFVNNFSEVSNELLAEMQTELEEGNPEEAKAIANDVRQNLEKILHHGKRADAIVKGMLQHSRSSSGQKEMTDINALADEYLRLAYHGLRAKDKTFNASFKTDFDSHIGKVSIIPQDIGRAILNLITNAFYVVNEKKKQLPGGYEPTVTVSTKKERGKVEVKVKDNGNGIPKKVLDKIFQPFFTTKPTGQGTGLGLSLSYDIVKAHGGELKVETKEGVGSSFFILLPSQ